MTVSHQAPLSSEFSRQEYWSSFPSPSPGDLPDPWTELRSPTLEGDSLPSEPPGSGVLLYQMFSNVEVSLKLCNGWRLKILKLMIEICVIKEQKIYIGWIVYYCWAESRNCLLLAINLHIYLRIFASKVLKGTQKIAMVLFPLVPPHMLIMPEISTIQILSYDPLGNLGSRDRPLAWQTKALMYPG